MKPTPGWIPVVATLAVIAWGSIEPTGASIPDVPNSSIPCQINLVGMTNGAADAVGEFIVVIRDPAMNPMPGASVVIDFNGCTDIRVATTQPFAGVTADCTVGPVGVVQAVTNDAGIATFRIVGGARNLAPGTPGSPFKCGRVYADGVQIGTVNIGSFDENATGGANPVDISLWLSDAFSGVYVGRSDYDCNQEVRPNDLARLLSVAVAGTSFASSGSYCF